jgi:hypothetical protein
MRPATGRSRITASVAHVGEMHCRSRCAVRSVDPGGTITIERRATPTGALAAEDCRSERAAAAGINDDQLNAFGAGLAG